MSVEVGGRGIKRSVVEGNKDSIAADTDIAVESGEKVVGKGRSGPGTEGRRDTLAELVKSGLGIERESHVVETDVDVVGGCAIPGDMAIVAEELLDMPTVGKVADQ